MNEETDELINHYLDRIRKGSSISEVRKDLQDKGMQEEEIKDIIIRIDDLMIEEALEKAKGSKVNEIRNTGIFIMVAGGLVTLLTYTGIINLQGYYIAAWGPIVGGYGLVLYSRRMKLKERKAGRRSGYFKRR